MVKYTTTRKRDYVSLEQDIDQIESQSSIYILNEKELEFKFNQLMNTVEQPLDSDNERTASSVIYSYYKNWNLHKAIKYYSLDPELAEKYWNHFNFKLKEGGQTMSRPKTKQNNIVSYLEKNVGEVVTPAKVSTDVSISLPTFYNFYNTNRQFFKKVKRGQFEIVNPESERNLDK